MILKADAMKQMSLTDRLQVSPGSSPTSPATSPTAIGVGDCRRPTTVAGGSATVRFCSWCRQEQLANPRAVFCSRRCRQSAWRLRRRRELQSFAPGQPAGIFAYADPPYPGTSSKYYRDHPDYAGEVDHQELIASLRYRGYMGWALSTSPRALRDILPLCPLGARICAWVKPIGVSSKTYGLHDCWEALIVVGGRKRRPGIPDWLRAQPARGWGELMGRKPLAFCAWLFDCLGMSPGDELVDLYPGSGMITRAWQEICRSGSADDSAAGATVQEVPV
ncbi:hypothetical protein MYX75_09515 [Acidobacteria bacterium AH-259-A15]|nr:hypothetical protein [Acidobacteria bacterium AH-259-A15]